MRRPSRFPPTPTGTTRLREQLTIRDVRAGDEDGLLAVLRDLQAHELTVHDRTRRPEDVGLPYIDALKQDTADGKGHILVAEAGGVILGYASLILCVSMEDERDEIPYTHAYVGDLGVLASQRGGGIGSALLAACEDLARKAGQRWIRLGVLAANSRARAFYAREGYGEHLVTLEKSL